jgi:catechol 2,3-dioxygenase-like lactoylglutathione lyase family enzyme
MLNDSPGNGVIAAADREGARAFYRDTLGLELIDEDHFALVFALRGAALRVTIVETVMTVPWSVLGWTVEDIRQSVLALRSRGVVFERFPSMKQDTFGIWTSPGGARVAWFKDPAGNTLSLTEATVRQLTSGRAA